MGWILFIPGLILGVIELFGKFEPDFLSLPVLAIVSEPPLGHHAYFRIIENNITDEITALMLILGAIFIALSREKHEDEFIAKIRLESLVWATYVNYGLLALSILFIYDLSFFFALMINMFAILIFFTLRFNWALRAAKKMTEDEK